jgi:excisionase family DNA binding protein
MSDERKLPVTYTAQDVAKILNRRVETIRRLINQKKIPAVKIGGQYVITEETLQRLLRGEIDTEDS